MGIGDTKYSLKSDENPRALNINLPTDDVVYLWQDFGNEALGTLDIEVPLPESQERSNPDGIKSKSAKLIRHGLFYTLAIEAKMISGSIVIEPYLVDLSGIVLTFDQIVFEGESSVTINSKAWNSYALKFKPSKSLAYVGLKIRRKTADQFTSVDITNTMFVLGAYDKVPYTGDPLMRAIPKGAIIMFLGDSCPPGFDPIDGDIGLFPRTVDGGTSEHTIDPFELKIGTAAINQFEGFDSKVYITDVISTSNSTDRFLDREGLSVGPIDVPDDRGLPSHTHKIEKAGNDPASVSFLLCARA